MKLSLILLSVLAFESLAAAQNRSAATDHWVATWATSQPLAGTSTVRPGGLMLSDPVDLEIARLADLAVYLYVAKDPGPPTDHNFPLHTTYISKGDTAAQEVMPEPTTTRACLWLSAVDVTAAPNAFA